MADRNLLSELGTIDLIFVEEVIFPYFVIRNMIYKMKTQNYWRITE